MTTTTFDASASLLSGANRSSKVVSLKLPRFRPTWPELPADSIVRRVGLAAMHVTLAAGPVAGLAWLFVSR